MGRASTIGWWLKTADARIVQAFQDVIKGQSISRREWQLLEPAGDAALDPVEGGVGGLGAQPQPHQVRAHAAGSRTERDDKTPVAVEFRADPSRPMSEVFTQLSEVALRPIGVDEGFQDRHGGVLTVTIGP